jgi:hypothetical protein
MSSLALRGHQLVLFVYYRPFDARKQVSEGSRYTFVAVPYEQL